MNSGTIGRTLVSSWLLAPMNIAGPNVTKKKLSSGGGRTMATCPVAGSKLGTSGSASASGVPVCASQYGRSVDSIRLPSSMRFSRLYPGGGIMNAKIRLRLPAGR